MTLVKICGINSDAAFDAAVEAAADYVGFVFVSGSPRFISFQQARELSARRTGSRRAGPRSVGLFVSPRDEDVAAALAALRLDVLQIYADAARVRAIKRTFGVATWRAVGVAGTADLPADAEGLDGFVIEAKPPPDATRPGGNAARLEWDLLTGWQAPAPWLLAGGLNAGNVAEALALSQAPGVDVSSGVETAPGVKSPELIRAFAAAARG